MGHTWHKFDPAGAAEEAKWTDRLLELRKNLKYMPFSCFTVSDFEALYRVMGLDIHKEAREEDFVRLEQRVRERY